MCRALVPAVMASLLISLPIAAGAASDPPRYPLAPQRLVVDSVSAPVLSVDQAAQTVEIVLIPDGEYRPVHPDSLGTTDGVPSNGTADTTGDDADRP